jgi:FkbM family methyltransferase
MRALFPRMHRMTGVTRSSITKFVWLAQRILVHKFRHMKKQLRSALRTAGVVAVSTKHRAADYLSDFSLSSFRYVLLRVFPSLEGLVFLQIGANDGRRFDPIHDLVTKHRWRGVLVEPVPEIHRSLRETYKDREGLQFLQAAVDLEKGLRAIYRLDSEKLKTVPEWAIGLATFDKEQLVGTALKLGLSEAAIVSEKVETVTWPELWAMLPGKRCDVLVVDTEGYDVPLLSNSDLEKHRPRVVHFEHALTSVPDRLKFYGRLIEMGYQIATDENDTTAWLAD